MFNSKCKWCGGPKEGHAVSFLGEFAKSVGMPVGNMEKGVKRGDGGEIVEINWRYRDLKRTLPVGDMHMPYLLELNLSVAMARRLEAAQGQLRYATLLRSC